MRHRLNKSVPAGGGRFGQLAESTPHADFLPASWDVWATLLSPLTAMRRAAVLVAASHRRQVLRPNPCPATQRDSRVKSTANHETAKAISRFIDCP